MLRAAALAASLLIAVPVAQAAPAKRAVPGRAPVQSSAKRARAPALPAAVAAMKALMRDRERRRFRHKWERAIGGLLAAARGRDAAAAWFEAGRARYALYRWSANESDRDKALILANRAARLGLKEARALAVAIRREAGDDAVEVARTMRASTRSRKAPNPAVEPVPEPPARDAEDSDADPAIAAAIADLHASPGPEVAAVVGELLPQPAGVGSPPAPTQTPALAPSDDAGQRAVRRIVVDAGHGGHDPGAIGRRGLQEKDVTLDIARKVALELRQEGFDVVLTRSSDRFLQLGERTVVANTARADLFVSIHANANPRRNRSGIETYFLNVTDDRYAARLAARENGADLVGEEGSDDVLKRIRADLDAVASAGSSRQLAGLVQRELCTSVRSSFGDVRDLGVKSALFYVLLGARMPAVLVETGFISNAAEEQRLASPGYRAEVAHAVTRAVRAFARADERVAAVR